MAGFYVTKYLGLLGGGEGAFYVGNGIVVGTDALGGIYDGSYQVANGILIGSARLEVPGGGLLATGQQVQANEPIDVRFSLPIDFATGEPQSITVGERTIGVIFQKVRDLP
ncbi:hypothetical protein [Aureimonas sp. Leaf324]|uniref:hypothetical protein n=1 Tax=Aureimonas sp. Leaf324 TaxID=1736336 RepID=UPI000B223B5C|nr:hypothetical protein [Aureimonas sp. Leaf324]